MMARFSWRPRDPGPARAAPHPVATLARIAPGLLPAAWIVAGLGMSFGEAEWPSAIALFAAIVLLGAGAAFAAELRGSRRWPLPVEAVLARHAARSRARPHAPSRAAPCVDWQWCPATDAMCVRFGGGERLSLGPARRLRVLLHADDRTRLFAWFARLGRNEITAPTQFRLALGDGMTQTIRAVAAAIRIEHGRVVEVSGTFQPTGAPVRALEAKTRAA